MTKHIHDKEPLFLDSVELEKNYDHKRSKNPHLPHENSAHEPEKAWHQDKLTGGKRTILNY
jgi:hypothetical protein